MTRGAPGPQPLERSIAAVRAARHVVVLTGAGISAESGIPTFRDALSGLWAQFRAEELATPEAFARDPDLVWSWYRWRRELVTRSAPNAGHHAVVRLEALAPRFTLVTQNVDGLHQRAGSSRVIELHGSLMRARCSRDDRIVERWEEPAEGCPVCERCGARLRPDVVWFGESLPDVAIESALDAARECDVLLSVGTSNLVHPAASLPWIAAGAGATVIVVNTTGEGQRSGDRIIHLLGRAGDILPALVTGIESAARMSP